MTDHTTSNNYFPAYDGNGNVTSLVKATNQTVSARYEYGPFGELLRATGPLARVNPFRFSTKYWDEETDLVYYGYRYYSPSLGRWISRDLVEDGLNEYCAFKNSSLVYYDPDGKEVYVVTTKGSFMGMFDHVDVYVPDKEHGYYVRTAAFGDLHQRPSRVLPKPDEITSIIKLNATKAQEKLMLDMIKSGDTALAYAYCAPRAGEILKAGHISGYGWIGPDPGGFGGILANPTSGYVGVRGTFGILKDVAQQLSTEAGQILVKVRNTVFETMLDVITDPNQ